MLRESEQRQDDDHERKHQQECGRRTTSEPTPD
jgi:hypothetical protein